VYCPESGRPSSLGNNFAVFLVSWRAYALDALRHEHIGKYVLGRAKKRSHQCQGWHDKLNAIVGKLKELVARGVLLRK
jgi:hypothetical protein